MAKSSRYLNRRDMLVGGATLGLFQTSTVSAQISNTPQDIPSDTRVTVTLDGKAYQYPGGPQIPSYSVGFRDDGRIVFHLGEIGRQAHSSPAVKLYQLGPHHVRIERNGKVAFDADISAHWWDAQWTYRPNPVAVIKTPAQIVTANRMFPFGNTGCNYGTVTAAPYKIMDGSSLVPYMPTTGERADIGLITDWSAWYMLKGDAGPMLEIGKAADSFPFHYRDEATGKPIDLLKYPTANTNDRPGWGDPWIQRYPLNADGSANIGGGLYPQQAHFPEMSYIAHIATGDLGFLENLQYAANYTTLCDANISHIQNKAIPSGEMRGIAWALRNLFMAHVATLDAETRGALPAYLHPSSYWETILRNTLNYYSPIMKNPDAQVFRVFAGTGKFSPAMMGYMINTLAFGVLAGHADWAPMYLWCLGNVIGFTSGKSGFPPGFGIPGWVCTFKDNIEGNRRFSSWSELYEDIFTSTEFETRNRDFNRAVYDRLKTDPLNGGKAFTGHEFMMTSRANLVSALYLDGKWKRSISDGGLGLTGPSPREAYPDIDACVANVERMFRAYGSVNPRVSMVSR